MRYLRVELDEDTIDALETERRLIGFESRGAYVQWLIDNRASIAAEPVDADGLIEAYRDRIAELERRLAARTDRGPPTDETSQSATRDGPRSEANGWTRSKSHPSVEVRGSPRRTVSRREPGRWRADGPATDEQASRDDETTTETTQPAVESGTDGGSETAPSESASTADSESASESNKIGGGNQRIARIQDDPLSKDADVLETVELDRLDELSRRAVAKTRTRLNRPVETGLEYRSATTLADETIRPGEDVVDLDAIDVPGHDDAVVAARREVIGRAVALLRDEGQARKADFVDALYDPYPAGYETADSWWACLKHAFRQIESIEGGDGSRIWQFTG